VSNSSLLTWRLSMSASALTPLSSPKSCLEWLDLFALRIEELSDLGTTDEPKKGIIDVTDDGVTCL